MPKAGRSGGRTSTFGGGTPEEKRRRAAWEDALGDATGESVINLRVVPETLPPTEDRLSRVPDRFYRSSALIRMARPGGGVEYVNVDGQRIGDLIVHPRLQSATPGGRSGFPPGWGRHPMGGYNVTHAPTGLSLGRAGTQERAMVAARAFHVGLNWRSGMRNDGSFSRTFRRNVTHLKGKITDRGYLERE